MTPIKALRQQLGKLQRLAQPYFLPLDGGGAGSAWQFLLLMIAMLAVVVGTTLLLLTGFVAITGALIPQLQERFLPGVPEWVGGIWQGWIGKLVMACFVAGLLVFGALRQRLRQGRWLPWLLLGVIVLLILVINGINVGISYVARNIENALVAYKQEEFWNIVVIYAGCLVAALPIRGLQGYLVPRLGLLWRQWLTSRLIGRYMENRAYYILNPNDESQEEIDNPDQRISQDANSFTVQSLSFTVGVFEALLTFVSFIIVLWTISTKLALVLLSYSVIGTAVIVFAGRKLVQLNNQQLKLEADFRYGLVHVRDNAEAIAFYKGEDVERREADRRLDGAITNYNRLIIWSAVITVIQRSYDYFSRFLPWLVIAPLYFLKLKDYGVFGQAGIAFSQVFFSVSFIVNNITELAAFSASISRLEGFQSKVESFAAGASSRVEAAAVEREVVRSGGAITLQHVDLVPPRSERLLIHDLSLSITADQRLLVVGPSGCGKTSFLRLISGLWSPGAGSLQRPPEGELLFIPQKPYTLLGSLREQLCYPQAPDRFNDDQLRHVLEEVRLGELIQRYPDLTIKQDWPRVLSLGEQQRLAFARLLLNAPRFVVLDEATSALDVATEHRLYELLLQREMAFVSVGHRPTLTQYHDTVLELDGQGGWRLMPAAGYSFGVTS
ncbi:MAG: ABC transporter ATP-binding protein/permease [Synechococcus sp. ELA057]|jgi:putative ATP-binding cassette transporter